MNNAKLITSQSICKIGVGDMFTPRNVANSPIYILANIGMQSNGSLVCLISLATGNYWRKPMPCLSCYDLTPDEFKSISINGNFVRLEKGSKLEITVNEG